MPRNKEVLKETAITTIGGDRRRELRFAAGFPVHYSVIRNGALVGAGIGTSIDLSSNGMAFMADEVLQTGALVQITMEWPCSAANQPLELVVSGRVVRSDSRLTAIGYARHELRPLEQSMLAMAAS